MCEPSSSKPKRKRRWFQYSLRTFLLLVTAFCIWLGWLTHQARQQRAAVAWVEEMDGVVSYDYELDENGDHLSNAEPPGPTWLREAVGIDFMAEVRIVDLDSPHIKDITRLAELKSLRTLVVWGCEVSDVAPIAALNDLESLYLFDTYVRDVTPLARLTSLQYLDLDGTPVADLTPLSGLKNLRYLSVSYTPVSDVTPLIGCKHLQSLYLRGTQVTAEKVAELRKALPNCTIHWKPR